MRQIILTAMISMVFLIQTVSAITAEVSNGGTTDIGVNEVMTDFGMITGNITFKLGTLTWVPEEIWLLPENMDPYVFVKGLTQETVLDLPSNVTSSPCRTAVYYNESVGYGFKIFNTGTTTQINQDGTFCGLAYNGTYFVFVKY